MPQKRKPPPPVEIRKFSLREIEGCINKLRRRIEEVESLESGSTRYNNAKVSSIESNIRSTILEIFGENSPEYREHRYHQIWHGPILINDTDYDRQEKFEAGIPQTITMLEGLVSRLEEKREDVIEEEVLSPIPEESPLISSRKVFIVHGHDEPNTLRLEKILRERWKLDPIVLREEPGIGRTLIEKFEQEAQKAIYAFVLFTPDDLIEVSDGKYTQARPNVIFELGWFYGKLGRGRVCILFKKGTKIHSDLDGISRIEFNQDVTEKVAEIEKELQEVDLI